jgi:hypothetical protein
LSLRKYAETPRAPHREGAKLVSLCATPRRPIQCRSAALAPGELARVAAATAWRESYGACSVTHRRTVVDNGPSAERKVAATCGDAQTYRLQPWPNFMNRRPLFSATGPRYADQLPEVVPIMQMSDFLPIAVYERSTGGPTGRFPMCTSRQTGNGSLHNINYDWRRRRSSACWRAMDTGFKAGSILQLAGQRSGSPLFT